MISLEIENIGKTYGTGSSAAVALEGVNLSIRPGEFFFLLGPSGCGKTTLLRIIAGLIEPTKGRVLMGERDVTALPPEDRKTAMVFQNYALWPHMTVRRNVEFGPKMRGVPTGRRHELAGECLDMVQMLQYAGRKPSQLSGGQQQRVAVARALAARPDILLLDEPLSNLDARLRQHMRDELRQLVKSSGVTAVYVTHDQKEAMAMADRIAVMNAGRLAQVGEPRQLYDRPGGRFVADFLGEANFLDGRVLAVRADQVRQGGYLVKIATSAGELDAFSDSSIQAGSNVACMVRPERVDVFETQDRPAGAGCIFKAVVRSATYLGQSQQATCVLPGGTPFRIEIPGGQSRLAPSLEISLLIHPRDVVILERDKQNP
ncbi:MAG: ABC transporter ATP-binding protein [Planctomycetes bacterium]|nr:ABC transporter ATP-binding protein [Planctomycetota bacterium]